MAPPSKQSMNELDSPVAPLATTSTKGSPLSAGSRPPGGIPLKLALSVTLLLGLLFTLLLLVYKHLQTQELHRTLLEEHHALALNLVDANLQYKSRSADLARNWLNRIEVIDSADRSTSGPNELRVLQQELMKLWRDHHSAEGVGGLQLINEQGLALVELGQFPPRYPVPALSQTASGTISPLSEMLHSQFCYETRCTTATLLPMQENRDLQGVLALYRDLSPLAQRLRRNTDLRTGLVSVSEDASEPWLARIVASNIDQNDLNKLTALMPYQSLLHKVVVTGSGADLNAWTLLPLNTQSGLYMLVQIPDPAMPGPPLNLIAISCLMIVIIAASVVFMNARGLSSRIKRHGALLPLLGHKHYLQVRQELQNMGHSLWPDESDLLGDAVEDLSFQLESREQVSEVLDQEMERLSLFDGLTGLANRHLLQYETQNDIRALHGDDHDDRMVAIVLMDLDKFKRIIDSLGHQQGDLILEQIAERLINSLGNVGLVARPGGDEFAILVRSAKRQQQLQTLSQKVLELVRQPLRLSGTTLVISGSIGVSIAGEKDSASDLLKHAEIAMYKAKEMGGNQYCLFNADMATEVQDNLSLESEIRRGFGNNEFTLYLQPKVNMDGKIQGFESLVRWDHPDRGVLSPFTFIPAMENMGFISQLDNWILETSCRQLKVLEALYPDISIAVNISSAHFTQRSFLAFLKSCLKKYPINPNNLELEITETMLMENMNAGLAVIQDIKKLGVRIAIDDFGTGYSSLGYLKKLPVDTLKIDREFIKDIPDSEQDMQISSVIIFLAKQLHFKVVAEGVETSEQLVFLKASQCDLAQGFYFSRPIPAHKAVLMLESERLEGQASQDAG
ncbi:bifunctional diguanylate cyclase/phosphodiesterase [Pseudomaricurvus alkylphenolicus]|uniref:putative bifunctional diguanylate cyclase/phosphodiesterase n=1 Tax=Pseudomaricurvus alkylphenolicus TaxID=1306991 RepID=UPI0014238B10|nr:bifunctional diguanylate cyclase/phosphodiesterase [Pseudomaricurvus alkylphenolicus]NIB43568.1 bifunctional diguanylate cyclase/phosphodiesterase [Pseudomaricurvus alkylphenolicus]